MSASSSPTLRPRSRRPSAILSAVVDLPTPPLPEATAMTALTLGISACRDIGEPPGGCGGCRCAEAGLTPPAGAGRGGGGGALPGLRSAVSAIMAVVTPGMARTAASACARTSSQARASWASTLIEKNTLPSPAVIADSTPASVKAVPRGDRTLESASRTCCCVTLKTNLSQYDEFPSPLVGEGGAKRRMRGSFSEYKMQLCARRDTPHPDRI